MDGILTHAVLFICWLLCLQILRISYLALSKSFGVVVFVLRLVNVGKTCASRLQTNINFWFIKSSFTGDSSQYDWLIKHSVFLC